MLFFSSFFCLCEWYVLWKQRHVNQVECRRRSNKKKKMKKWGSSLHSDLAWLPGMQLASIQSLPIHDGTAAVDICSPTKEEDINQAHLEQVSRWMPFSPLTVCPRLVEFFPCSTNKFPLSGVALNFSSSLVRDKRRGIQMWQWHNSVLDYWMLDESKIRENFFFCK